MNDDGLILAAEFNSSPQALAACGLLRSAGIPAALKRGMPGITQPNWAHVDNDGLLLMVPVSFLAQARALLDSRVPEQDFNAAAKRAGSLKSDPGEINADAKNASDAESNQMTRQGRTYQLKIFALIVLLMVLASVGKVALDFTKYVLRR